MDVLRKINKLRLERNWSVYRLSVKSGISQSTLTNMFNRETQPSIATLKLLCDAFGITLSEFFADFEAEKEVKVDEAEFIKAYRTLPESVKCAIYMIVDEYINK